MKSKIAYFILLLLLGTSSYGQEEMSKTYKNELKFGFFQFFTGRFHLEFEHYLNSGNSILFQGEVTMREDYWEETVGAGGGFQYRIYFGLDDTEILFVTMEDFYFAPAFAYRYLNVTEYNEVYNMQTSTYDVQSEHNYFNIIRGGVLVGLKFNVQQRFTLDLNFGGGIQYDLNDSGEREDFYDDYSVYGAGYNGVLPMGNFTIGLRF